MASVTVVVPTRNRSRLLVTTLCSVLSQRDVELEVVVVDDASTDDTHEVVDSIADDRVTVVRQAAPGGPSAARNRGAVEARGEWVAFVDDDDVWAPDKLASQVQAAEVAGRGWAYVGAVSIGGELEIVAGHPPPTPDEVVAALPRYNAVPGGGSGVIVRSRLLTEVGGFDERFPPCEDWELWLRLAHRGPPAVAPRPLMGYRLHAGSSSLDISRIVRSVRLIEHVHGAAVDWGRVHRWLAESCLRRDRHARALGELVKAAVRGDAGGVATDLAAIVRRRLGRPPPGRADPDPWIAAASWLDALKRCTTAGSHQGERR